MMQFLDKPITRKDFFKGLAVLAVPATIPAFAQSTGSTQSFINVKDHGATGDGVTDDTNAIQSVMQSNVLIYFPPGTYIISSAIELNTLQNIHIYAAGAVIQNSNLSTYSFQIDHGSFVTFAGGEYTRSSTVDASSSSEYACLRFISCTDVIVQNVFINGSPGMGVCLMNCVEVKILNNIIKNTTRDGIYSHYGVNLIYSGNYLENIKDDAMSMHDYGFNAQKTDIIALGYPQAGNGIICNNKVKNAMQGVSSISSQGLTIANNIFEHVVNSGIQILNTDQAPMNGPNAYVQDVVIANNIVSYACLRSYTILGAQQGDQGQNGSGKAAISVGSYDSGFQNGVGLKRLANVSITGNMVNYSEADAYFVNNTDGVVFSNNSCRNCNTNPLSPYTGYMVEIWNCTDISAFNNSILLSPNAIGGCRVWNSTGITGGWLTSYTNQTPYVAYPGSTAVDVINGSPIAGSNSLPDLKY
jgi:hypothetical protein